MSDLVNKTESEDDVNEDDDQSQADFDAGVAMENDEQRPKVVVQDNQPARDDAGRFVATKDDEKPVVKDEKNPPVKDDKKPSKKVDGKTDEKPKFVQVTEEQFARLTAAADRTDGFEKQFSKAFGTIGDMQKIMRTLQSQTPRGLAVKIPDGAFDEMKKDFPELADKMQVTMEAILKGAEGTGAATSQVDEEAFNNKLEARVLKMAADDLADEFPDWHKIVGAVNVKEGATPDPNNPFRKWLATKPQEYQDRINTTNSAGVITRAIRTFKSETKAPIPPKPTPKPNTRIQDAVRPKGDGGHAPGTNADDEFEAGFRTG